MALGNRTIWEVRTTRNDLNGAGHAADPLGQQVVREQHPVGDFGFRVAVKNRFRLRKEPGLEGYIRHAEPWRPFRSIATWYLWRSLDPKYQE